MWCRVGLLMLHALYYIQTIHLPTAVYLTHAHLVVHYLNNALQSAAAG